jgi:uncharacterized DUF497 family protein
MTISSRQRLLLRATSIVAVVIAAKLLVHFLGWEMLSINPLFSGIVAANVFLMGFLLSGVLADFKESERLSGELSACLETLAQEVSGIRMAQGVFDPFVRWMDSEVVEGEERERVIGMTADWQLLIVAHVERGDAVRVISARPATSEERRKYEDY